MRSWERLRGFLEPTAAELIRFFTLSPADVRFVVAHRSVANRLGLAVQLCTLPWLGFVPDDVESAPPVAVARLAEPLGVETDGLVGYGERGQTRTDHLREVLAHTGWTVATSGEWKGLDEFLLARALEHDSPRLLFTAAGAYLRSARVVRPGVVNVLERVAAARERARVETWHRVAPVLDAGWLDMLDRLLVVDDDLGETRFAWLERATTTASPASVRVEIAKLTFLHEAGADRLDLSMLTLERRRFLARVARRSSVASLARRDRERRYPMLACLVTQSAVEVLDEIVGLFDQLLSSRESHAKVKAVDALAERARTGEDRQALLDELLELIVDLDIADDELGGQIRHGIGMDRLRLAWEQRPRRLPRDHGHLDALDESLSHVRKFAPHVLKTVAFAGGVGSSELLRAVEMLTDLYRSAIRHVPLDAPATFVPARWRGYLDQAAASGDHTAYRHYWELCVLLALRDGLRSGDVHVPGSRRYADPTSFLLDTNRWLPLRVEFCALVGKPVDPGGAIAEVTSELHVALGELDAVLTDRSGPGEVRLDDNGDLIIPPLVAAPVPEEAAVLRDDLARLLPQVTLASILVELDSRVGLFPPLRTRCRCRRQA